MNLMCPFKRAVLKPLRRGKEAELRPAAANIDANILQAPQHGHRIADIKIILRFLKYVNRAIREIL